MNNKEKKDYIDILALLNRFFRYFKMYWSIILLISFMLMGAVGVLSLKPATVTYSSQITFSYGLKIGDATEFSYSLAGLPGNMNIDSVSSTLTQLLNTSVFRNKLQEKLDTDYIDTAFSVSFAAGTNLGKLSAESGSKENVTESLTAALEILPEVALPVIGPIEIHIQGEAEEVSESVVTPSVAPLALGGFAAGLFLGLGVLALLALMRHQLSSEADIFNSLSLKVLGVIPLLHAKGTIPLLDTIKRKWLLLKTGNNPKRELIKTPSYQAYLRLLSTQISQVLKEKHFRNLLIMSTRQGEGKTFIAEALSNELSEGGWTVRMVRDLDEYDREKCNWADNEITLFDLPGTTADLITMEAAEIADASLLIVKSDTDLAADVKWGLHFLKNCRAECIGAVLNAFS